MNKAMSKYLRTLKNLTKYARESLARGRGSEAWKKYFDSLMAIQDVMMYDEDIEIVEFKAFVKLCSKKLREFDKYYF
jgi:hypothetical protein